MHQCALRVRLYELREACGRFPVLARSEALHGLVVGGLLRGVGDLYGRLALLLRALLIALRQMAQAFHFSTQARHFLLQVLDLVGLLHADLAALVDERAQLFAQVEYGASGFVVGERMGGSAAQAGGHRHGHESAPEEGRTGAHVFYPFK